MQVFFFFFNRHTYVLFIVSRQRQRPPRIIAVNLLWLVMMSANDITDLLLFNLVLQYDMLMVSVYQREKNRDRQRSEGERVIYIRNRDTVRPEKSRRAQIIIIIIINIIYILFFQFHSFSLFFLLLLLFFFLQSTHTRTYYGGDGLIFFFESSFRTRIIILYFMVQYKSVLLLRRLSYPECYGDRYYLLLVYDDCLEIEFRAYILVKYFRLISRSALA